MLPSTGPRWLGWSDPGSSDGFRGRGASLIAQLVKNPPAMQETPVQFLSWEDPLQKGTAPHTSVLARRILWTEEPGRL